MSIIKELQELEPRHYVVGVVTVMLLAGPGFLVIFLYRPTLIVSLDIFKLMVASGALTLPLAAVNFFAAWSLWSEDDSIDVDGVWVLDSALTTLLLYIALYAAYLQQLPFKQFTLLAMAFEVMLLVGCTANGFWRKRKKVASN